MPSSIAFFDFDGTITTKDTLLEFIKFSKGRTSFLAGFALNSPWLVAYRIKLIPNQTAKERILRFFFGKKNLADFQSACDSFSRDIIPRLVRPKALREIRRLQQLGFEVVVVSASPGNWLRQWADSLNLTLIATRLQTSGSQPLLTGRLEGLNCYGEEKVRRIREMYDLSQYDIIQCYGDTSGDRPMLALGSASFYKPFR